MKEEFLQLKTNESIKPCPYCGAENELWQHDAGHGHAQKVVMCSNSGDEDNGIEPCPMNMPPEGFYMATKREAIKAANSRAPVSRETNDRI